MTGGCRARGAFTLVELLTVIGIIGLVVAMLLPTLGLVRAQGQSARCAATLSAIGKAAALHVGDHGGYLPAAGWHFAPVNGVCDPAGLEDLGAKRYTYYDEGGVRRPAPVTVALAASMGVKVRLDSRENVEADAMGEDVARHFRCVAQGDEVLAGLSQREDSAAAWTGPMARSSYVFNEAVLGRRDVRPNAPPAVHGNLARVRRTGAVMLAMDGRPRNLTNDQWIMVFDKGSRDSVYDFQQLTLGDNAFGKDTLDFARHRGRANVLYLDGHVAAVTMDAAGLRTVGVTNGVYE